jgi:hypothetical protein
VLLLVGGLAWLLPGCAPPREALVAVSGAVTVEGEPLPLGWVTYYPDAAKGNTSTHLPWGEISKDGAYELSTNGKPGAAPGWYKVVVAATRDAIPVKPPRTADGKPWRPRWLTHEKYTKPSTTDLEVEVAERAAPGSYDLRLSR